VEFIHARWWRCRESFGFGSSLEVCEDVGGGIPAVTAEYDVTGVVTNTDYEPYATERDQAVTALLATKGVWFVAYKIRSFSKGGSA